MAECKYPSCTNEARTDGQDQFANNFCSDECEVGYDHIKADAEDARAAEEAAAEETDNYW